MIYTSLAVIALSASSAISPLSNFVHLHGKPVKTDTRITMTLVNKASLFRDVKVDNHTYTVMPLGTLSIKAPAGTKVYAESAMPFANRGDVLLEVTPQLDHQRVNLN